MQNASVAPTCNATVHCATVRMNKVGFVTVCACVTPGRVVPCVNFCLFIVRQSLHCGASQSDDLTSSRRIANNYQSAVVFYWLLHIEA